MILVCPQKGPMSQWAQACAKTSLFPPTTLTGVVWGVKAVVVLVLMRLRRRGRSDGNHQGPRGQLQGPRPDPVRYRPEDERS
jgi:hypothetical protein